MVVSKFQAMFFLSILGQISGVRFGYITLHEYNGQNTNKEKFHSWYLASARAQFPVRLCKTTVNSTLPECFWGSLRGERFQESPSFSVGSIAARN